MEFSNTAEIGAARDKIIAQYGPWTANIRLADDIWTLGKDSWEWPEYRARLAAYYSEIFLDRHIDSMLCLDIGCLEGSFSLTLGLAGAEVVGIDIRAENLVKAEFARDVLGLGNVRFQRGDMLKLEELKLGHFDLIIASGVLYHVDTPDLLGFLRSLHRHCRGILMVDTHIATTIRESFTQEGNEYNGQCFVEFGGNLPKTSWSSMDNQLSFWLTERSLTNLFIDAGFQFMAKPVIPHFEYPWRDRIILLAIASVESRVSGKYGAPYKLRASDPDPRAMNHPMMDDPTQQDVRRTDPR